MRSRDNIYQKFNRNVFIVSVLEAMFASANTAQHICELVRELYELFIVRFVFLAFEFSVDGAMVSRR